MILAFLIHHNWDMWDILIILIILAIIFWKRIAMVLLNLLLIPLMLPIALVSVISNWEPKFVKKWEKEIEEYKKNNQQQIPHARQ